MSIPWTTPHHHPANNGMTLRSSFLPLLVTAIRWGVRLSPTQHGCELQYFVAPRLPWALTAPPGRWVWLDDTTNRFHHLRLPQISCSEGKAVQVASVFLRGVGGSGGGWGVVISFS